MKDYERLILDQLLDRYERSSHFRQPLGSRTVRGVYLPFDPKTFPDYWVEETPDYRLEINRAARSLAGRSLIRLYWAPLARGQVLAKAGLVLDQVDAAYAAAGRRPKRDKEGAWRDAAEAWLTRWGGAGGDAPSWGASLLRAVIEALAAHRPLPLGLSLDQPAEFDRLCRVIDALDRLEDELPRRIFSVRTLGDSKALDGRLGRLLVKAVQQFSPMAEDLEDQEEVLASLGLVNNPQHLFVSGPLVIGHGGRLLDLGDFHPDVGLPVDMVQKATIERLDVDAVLTVENLTSYYETARWLQPGQHGGHEKVLAVYLGGYHNRVRRLFLVKLWQFAQTSGRVVRFYHWGDLDLGGVEIFHHLAARTGIPLEPWLMDAETYLAHLDAGTSFDSSYRSRLRDLMGQPGYEPFHDLLAEMVGHGLRIEQESIRPVLPLPNVSTHDSSGTVKLG